MLKTNAALLHDDGIARLYYDIYLLYNHVFEFGCLSRDKVSKSKWSKIHKWNQTYTNIAMYDSLNE